MGLIVRDQGVCAYATALALQEELVSGKIAGATDDVLLLLEHEPVYTLGRGADAQDVLDADRVLGVPLFRVSRGGGVTFHGPGQFVAYPILTLVRGRRDVHGYVRSLENVVIGVCADFDIAAGRRPATTGVWVGEKKIASIGVGIRRWTTFHGVALNVTTDLRYFSHIVPCRMPDVRMTSMAAELGSAPAMAAVRASFVARFRSEFDYATTQPAACYA